MVPAIHPTWVCKTIHEFGSALVQFGLCPSRFGLKFGDGIHLIAGRLMRASPAEQSRPTSREGRPGRRMHGPALDADTARRLLEISDNLPGAQASSCKPLHVWVSNEPFGRTGRPVGQGIPATRATYP